MTRSVQRWLFPVACLLIGFAGGGGGAWVVYHSREASGPSVSNPETSEPTHVQQIETPRLPTEEHIPEPARHLLGNSLDTLQRRAITDSWVLHGQRHYRRRTIPLKISVKETLERAAKKRRAGQIEIGLDTDEDGVNDVWVWYQGDRPTTIELDKLKTGCRDFLIDVREKEATVREFHAWSVEPPVAGPSSDLPAELPLFDLAWRTETKPARVCPQERLASQLFPGLEDRLARMENQHSRRVLESLEQFQEKVARILPRFLKIHREEKLAASTRTSVGYRVDFRPYDLDGQPGKEVLVGYSPRGVEQIRFFARDWLAGEEPVADCHLVNGDNVRIDLEGRRYLRLTTHWARVAMGIRERVTRLHLEPGFRDFRQGRWYDAVAHWQRANQLAGLLGDRDLQEDGTLRGEELDELGLARWRFSVAGIQAAHLLRLADCLGGRRNADDVSRSFQDLAEDALRRQDTAEADTLFRLGIRFAEKLEDERGKAFLLEAMSRNYQRRGNYDRAIECLFEAIDLESTLGYAQRVADGLRRMAADTRNLDLRGALAMRSHAMAVNRCGRLGTIAALYADVGEQERAENYLAEAERQVRILEHRYLEADLRNLRARWELAQGRWEMAIERLENVLERIQSQASKQEQLEGRESGSPLPKGDWRETVARDQSLHHFVIPRNDSYHVVTMRSTTHPSSYLGFTAGQLGEAYLQGALDPRTDRTRSQQLFEQSAAVLARAETWYAQARDSTGQIVSQLRQATLALHRGQSEAAETSARRLEAEARKHGLFEVVWRAASLQGTAARRLRQTDRALDHFQRAAREIESVRALNLSEPVRRGFLGSKLDVYEALVELHLERKDHEKAWAWMERAKARTLLDVLAGQPVAPRGPEAVEASQRMPLFFHQGGRGIEAAQKEIDGYLARLGDRPNLAEIASLRSVQPVTTQQVDRILAPGQLVLEYFETEGGLFVALLQRGRVEVRRIELDRHRLLQLVEELRKQFEDPLGDYEKSARELGARLITSLLAGREGVEHLILIPGGVLHYLPFQALLVEGDRFLVEKYLISYSPSASSLVYAVDRQIPAGLKRGTLIVAEPAPGLDPGPLDYARVEGRRVRDLCKPSRLLLGKEATESAILAELPRSRTFHFAGHTQVRPSAPMRTALLCSPDLESDGRLEVRELFGLNLRGCDLAVLSACQTQVGRHCRGDEIVSMQRAFLRAGVPSVVASLWKVQDEATCKLMVRFHEHLARSGKKAWSLAEAQREYLTDRLAAFTLTLEEKEEFEKRELALHRQRGGKVVPRARSSPGSSRPHPYFWAAFGLHGDWR